MMTQLATFARGSLNHPLKHGNDDDDDGNPMKKDILMKWIVLVYSRFLYLSLSQFPHFTHDIPE